MGFDKSVLKAIDAAQIVFDYRPKDFVLDATQPAKDFVDHEDQFRDFKISDLVSQQAGIKQLEQDAHQDLINEQVLEKFKDVQEKAYQEAYELGLKDGVEKAFLETKAEIGEKLSAFSDLLVGCEQMKNRLLVANEAELVALVFQVAKKIALRDLEFNESVIVEILKSVLGELYGDQRISVRVSSKDAEFLAKAQEKGDGPLEILSKIKLQMDESIQPGGCVIETEYGSVDAQVSERVERVWQTLSAKIPHVPRG